MNRVLREVRISPLQITDDFGLALVNAVLVSDSLQILLLNARRDISAKIIFSFVSTLKYNTTLSTLRLQSECIEDDDGSEFYSNEDVDNLHDKIL
jgi:hypothetical protein